MAGSYSAKTRTVGLDVRERNGTIVLRSYVSPNGSDGTTTPNSVSLLETDTANRENVRTIRGIEDRLNRFGKLHNVDWVISDIKTLPVTRRNHDLPYIGGSSLRQSDGGAIIDTNATSGGAPEYRGLIGRGIPSRLSPFAYRVSNPRNASPVPPTIGVRPDGAAERPAVDIVKVKEPNNIGFASLAALLLVL